MTANRPAATIASVRISRLSIDQEKVRSFIKTGPSKLSRSLGDRVWQGQTPEVGPQGSESSRLGKGGRWRKTRNLRDSGSFGTADNSVCGVTCGAGLARKSAGENFLQDFKLGGLGDVGWPQGRSEIRKPHRCVPASELVRSAGRTATLSA